MIGLVLAALVATADTNNHFAVCATLPSTSDTTTRTVYGIVSDPFTGLSLPAGFSGVTAEAVRAKLAIPERLPPLVFDARGQPTIVTTAAFSLMPSGAVQNVAVMSSSSVSVIDSLLMTAIQGAARDSSYPPLPPRAGSGIRLALELTPDSVAGAVPMFTLRVPVWRDFSPAEMAKVSPRRGPSDTLVVILIVDVKGAAMLATAHVERSPGTAIARGYLDSLSARRFTPGHIQKCAVRSLLRLAR